MKREQEPGAPEERDEIKEAIICVAFIVGILLLVTILGLILDGTKEAKSEQCKPKASIGASVTKDEGVSVNGKRLTFRKMVSDLNGGVLCADTKIKIHMDASSTLDGDAYALEERAYGVDNIKYEIGDDTCSYLDKNGNEQVTTCALTPMNKNSRIYKALLNDIRNDKNLAEYKWDDPKHIESANISIHRDVLVIDGLKCEEYCNSNK